MSKTPFILTFLIAAAIIGCTKKAVEDKTAPSITITSPTEGQSFMQMTTTDSATFSVHITDVDLHSYKVLITKTDGTDTLFIQPETHQEINDLTVTKKFPLHVITGTVNYKAVVNAEDHSGNEAEAVRNFSVSHM